MFRYLSFVWDPADTTRYPVVKACAAQLARSSTPWATAIGNDGLVILCSGERIGSGQAHYLHNGAGAVLGSVFSRRYVDGSDCLITPFDQDTTDSVVASGGRHLLKGYWGQYVAFVQNPLSRSTSVLVDPVGGLPCHFVVQQGMHVFFSDIADLEQLRLTPLSIDWRQLSICLLTGLPPVTGSTAIREVSTLRSGERAEVLRGRLSRDFCWNPFEIANTQMIEDVEEATQALRRTTRRCVHAWAHGHSSIVHRLSGGIDSNIVLACLRDAPHRPRVTCLNYYSPGSDTDERPLARIGAAHAQCELVEHKRNSSLRLEAIFDIAPSPNPNFYLGYLETSALEANLSESRAATLVTSGGSGDCVFYQSNAVFAVGDFIFHHGLRARLLRIAYHVARLERTSIWNVLKTGLADGLMKRPWTPKRSLAEARQFVTRGLVDEVESAAIHPWFENPVGAPNGKRWHAFLMMAPLGFYDPFGSDNSPDYVHPIQSQPLVELCLRIPTYVLTDGGWNRAVARRAFSQDVPPEIIWRRTKGGMQEHMQSILQLNIELIRDTLLNGVLVERGMLNRGRLEQFLSLRPTVQGRVGSAMAEVMEYLCLETWLRRMAPMRGTAPAEGRLAALC